MVALPAVSAVEEVVALALMVMGQLHLQLPAHRCWGLHPCCETLLIRLTGYGHAANERRGSDMHDEAGKCLEHHDHVALRPRGSMCWCSKHYNLQHRIYSDRIDTVRNRT